MTNKKNSKANTTTSKHWNSAHSARLYGIQDWGLDYFNVSDQGEVVARIENNGKEVAVPIIKGVIVKSGV